MRPTDDTGWKSRFLALQQLAKLRASAVPVLVESLQDESSAVRALSAQALGYCGSSEAKKSLAQRVESDPDGVVRLYAADSLGMLGGGDHDELLRRLEPDEKNSDAKRHLAYALDRSGEALEPSVVRQLSQWNVQQLDSARLNERAPDFELQSLDGQPVRLSQFHGEKSVVLVFVYGDT
jgi:HEAT repeat protein